MTDFHGSGGIVKKFSLGNFSSDHTFDIFDTDGNCNNKFIHTGKFVLVVCDHWDFAVGGPYRFLCKIHIYPLNYEKDNLFLLSYDFFSAGWLH